MLERASDSGQPPAPCDRRKIADADIARVGHQLAGVSEFLQRQLPDLLEGRGELLFLTLFGSSLYGTRCEGSSDVDVRGIYLPHRAPAGAAEVRAQKGLHLSSAGAGRRNTCEDVDVDLVPFEKWLCRSLPGGETGALDLLFAPTRPSCTLLVHPALQDVFAHPLDCLDLGNGRECTSYCLGQGNSYGLAGTRFGALFRVRRALEDLPAAALLGGQVRRLVEAGAAQAFCSPAPDGGLLLAGQWHMAGIALAELARRLDRLLEGRMERMTQARQGRGVDWKALSHAVRAIRQQEALLCRGSLCYPLDCREELVAIRQGRLSFARVEEIITDGLAGLVRLRRTSAFVREVDGKALWRKALAVRARCGQGT